MFHWRYRKNGIISGWGATRGVDAILLICMTAGVLSISCKESADPASNADRDHQGSNVETQVENTTTPSTDELLARITNSPTADLAIPFSSEISSSTTTLTSEQKRAALDYAEAWIKSKDVFIKRWEQAEYLPLDTRDACSTLAYRIPRIDSEGLGDVQVSSLIDAITAILAMNSCTGYSEYRRFAESRNATLKPDRLDYFRQTVNASSDRLLSDDEVIQTIWETIVYHAGMGPWRGLAVDHSEIRVFEMKGAYQGVRSELLSIGTPSTAFTIMAPMHDLMRQFDRVLEQEGRLSAATVRLLLRGASVEQCGPWLLRFWRDPESNTWMLGDEMLLLRESRVLPGPWF